MQALSWQSIGYYCLFGLLVNYQQLHVKNFQGANQDFGLALNVSAILGMATGLVYLLMYGWTVIWWAPIVIFLIGLITSTLGFLIERVVGAITLSVLAFVGWPVCAYFMFIYMPRGA